MEGLREILSAEDWNRLVQWCDGRPLDIVEHAVGYVLGYGRLPQDLDRLLPTVHPARPDDAEYFGGFRA